MQDKNWLFLVKPQQTAELQQEMALLKKQLQDFEEERQKQLRVSPDFLSQK